MNMSNMTPEELRDKVFDALGEDGLSWQVDGIIEVFADLCTEVIGPNHTENNDYAQAVNIEKKKARIRLTKLTGKEMNQ